MFERPDLPDVVAAEMPSRRRFLGWTAAVGGLIGALLGYPIGRMFAAPLFESVRKGERWIPIGSAADFGDERRTVEYSYEYQDGWYTATRTRRILVGKEEGEWVAFSMECTHVGCGVSWNAEKRQFICPCHNGIFDAEGRVVSGPPPRPLTRLKAREKDGRLEVLEV